MNPKVLIVDDEVDLLDTCEQVLAVTGHPTLTATDPVVGLRLATDEPVDLVLTDLRMPGMDGFSFLARLRELRPEVPVIVMTAYPSMESAVQAVKVGAFDYLIKPFSPDQLLLCVARALDRSELGRHNRNLREALVRGRRDTMIWASASFSRLVDQVDRAAATDATVLLSGETGSGKEVLARRTHALSPRREAPLISVNCAALPGELLEAELFGVEKGAYTDAARERPGLLECTEGGTLFLDEVADLPLSLQPKLLRVLEERAVRRVGGRRLIDVDFRLVVATNQDLGGLVADGRFREDLYYRLNVIRFHVPPLRDRREDIIPLADHLLRIHTRRYRRAILGFDPEVKTMLTAYDWPGNARQLGNVIERAVVLSAGETVTVLDLPDEVLGVSSPAGTPGALPREGETFAEAKRQVIDGFERSFVDSALRASGGHVSRAAESSGLGRSAFQRLMKRYRILSEGYR